MCTPLLSPPPSHAHTQLYLRVKADGFCTFPDGRLQPAGDALAALAHNGTLVDGVNSLRFEIRYRACVGRKAGASMARLDYIEKIKHSRTRSMRCVSRYIHQEDVVRQRGPLG